MLLNTLNNKKVHNKNGEDILDLTYPTLGPSKNGISKITNVFFVADMEMRPDLLSYVAYNNPEYFDYILKFNGISNPYSPQKNWLIYTPELNEFESKFETAKVPNEITEEDTIRTQYKVKTTGVDPSREKYHSLLKKLNNISSNPLKDILPPNIQVEGGNEGIIENDTLIL